MDEECLHVNGAVNKISSFQARGQDEIESDDKYEQQSAKKWWFRVEFELIKWSILHEIMLSISLYASEVDFSLLS